MHYKDKVIVILIWKSLLWFC